MNVALYYPWVYLRGGAERTLLNLMKRSRHTWTLYTNHYDAISTFPEFQDFPVVQLNRVSVRRNALYAGHAALTLLLQQLPVHKHDALMVTTESIGNIVTIRSGSVPLFCLCLTPLRVAYDPIIRARFQAGAAWFTRMAVNAFRWVDRPLWRRYRQVFAISEEVRSRLLNAGLVEPERITIARPGVDLEGYDPGQPAEPFFLAAGRIMWTKNLELAVDAFLEFKRADPAAAPFKLVIAGMVDRKSQPYLELLQRRAAPLGDSVQFVICPEDRQLRDLYARSYASLFTAFNEDWGLVPLESMASGRPVIATNRGGPRETILHEQTGLLVPPEPHAFAQQMSRLVHDPAWARQLGCAGVAHARGFGWEPFIETIDSHIDALRAPRGTCASVST